MFRSLQSSYSQQSVASYAAEEEKQCYQGLSRLFSTTDILSSTSSILGSDALSIKNALSLCFQGSHRAGTELRKVTCLLLSSLQSIPTLGSLRTIPGEPHNLLNDPTHGFSSMDYREFSSKPTLALYSIHYCVTGLQGLHQLSQESAAGSLRDIYYVSKEAGNLMKRLTASRDEGSTEKIFQAIEELRSSPFAYGAGADRIPELCMKLEELTPEKVRGIVRKEELKDVLVDLIKTVESYVVRVRSLINHDFLVLELHDVLPNGKVDLHFILAEKLSDPPGVFVRKEPFFQERYKQQGAVLFDNI